MKLVLGLILSAIALLGAVRGVIWFFEGHFGWAISNFVVYGLTALVARALVRSHLRNRQQPAPEEADPAAT